MQLSPTSRQRAREAVIIDVSPPLSTFHYAIRNVSITVAISLCSVLNVASLALEIALLRAEDSQGVQIFHLRVHLGTFTHTRVLQ